MSASLEIVEAQALKLAPADRSHLLERLISSLDFDAELQAAWEAEADRREDSLAAGIVTPIAAQEAVDRLKLRFAL